VATPFKDMEITCLLKNSTDRSAADALYALTASASFTDNTFAISEVLTPVYSAGLASASSPWDAIQTEAGFDIDFGLKVNPVKVDSLGVVDMSIGQLDISVKLKPVGMTVAQVLTQLKVQNTGVARGMSIGSAAANLTITGGTGNPVIVINKVRLKNAAQVYAQEALRHDTIEFVATRPTGSGAMFSVAIA
jgi:hypothetical protein